VVTTGALFGSGNTLSEHQVIFNSPGRRPWELMVMRSVRPSDFFSRTTWPISTTLGRNDAWVKGIWNCSNKRAGPFWGLKRGKIKNILINVQISPSHEALARMHWYLTWSTPRTSGLQFCSNEIPRVLYGPAPGT